MFSFGLKSGYHHVDILPEHRKFLALSWDFDARAQTRYFQFTVLPFGLSSAPLIFTKLLKPLDTFWRSQGIPIAIFFYDGVGGGASFPVAQNNSEFVRLSLLKSGFLVNREKSLWVPSRRFSWIGYVIDTHSGIISASDSRMQKCSADLNEACTTLEMSSSVHVKTLASLVSQIISFGSSFGKLLESCLVICIIPSIPALPGKPTCSSPVRLEGNFYFGAIIYGISMGCCSGPPPHFLRR